MLLTGHKSRAIFDRYNIIHEQELLDAGDQLVAYLAIRASVPERGTMRLRGRPGHPRMTRGRQRPTSYSLLRCRMLKRDLVRSYALIGAQARLAELDRERVDILETFPELDPRPPAASATTPGRKRRKMSDAAKKAASIRMKKYWARRKKAQQR